MQLSLAVLMQPILATQAYTFANDPAGAAAAIANHIVTDTQAKQVRTGWYTFSFCGASVASVTCAYVDVYI